MALQRYGYSTHHDLASAAWWTLAGLPVHLVPDDGTAVIRHVDAQGNINATVHGTTGVRCRLIRQEAERTTLPTAAHFLAEIQGSLVHGRLDVCLLCDQAPAVVETIRTLGMLAHAATWAANARLDCLPDLASTPEQVASGVRGPVALLAARRHLEMPNQDGLPPLHPDLADPDHVLTSWWPAQYAQHRDQVQRAVAGARELQRGWNGPLVMVTTAAPIPDSQTLRAIPGEARAATPPPAECAAADSTPLLAYLAVAPVVAMVFRPGAVCASPVMAVPAHVVSTRWDDRRRWVNLGEYRDEQQATLLATTFAATFAEVKATDQDAGALGAALAAARTS